MQFYAILGHFLPQDPGCAALRCTFISQIFYILCFSFFTQILDTLDHSQLDLCFVPVCNFMLLCTQYSPPILCSAFQNLFLFYMDVLQPTVPMATMTPCVALWPTVQLPQLHGNPCWSSSQLPCAPCSSATSGLPGFHFLAASSSLLCFSSISFSFHSWLMSSSSSSCSASSQFHCYRLFGLRGSVEI
jgi:hypothetical protein